MGHAFNNTLQDILIRFKRKQGYEALWLPGTDNAGIATQTVVERNLMTEENKNRHDLGRDKFVERIWEWKDKNGDQIIDQLKKMADKTLDYTGLKCPMPVLKTKKELKNLASGQVLEVIVDDVGAKKDIPALLNKIGDEFVELKVEGSNLIFIIKKA